MKVLEVRKAPQGEYIIRENKENMDDNGLLASQIIIQSNLSGLSFSAPGMGILRSREIGSDKALLVSADERFLMITSSDYVKPLEIVLRDYDIDLEPGETWIISIMGEETAPSNLVSVTLRIVPDDAEFYIDGERVSDYSRAIELAAGEHRFEVRKDLYSSLDQSINISKDLTFYEFELEALQPVPVSIRTNAPGANILLDGNTIGQTGQDGNRDFFRLPGDYQLQIISPGYATISESISILEEGNNQFEYQLAEFAGFLEVQSNQGVSTALINKNPTDIRQRVKLEPGVYLFEITDPAFEPYSSSFEIKQGDITELNIELTPVFGKLFYTSSPSNAEAVLFDESGNELDRWTGIQQLDLAPGEYRILLTATGYADQRDTFTILKDQVVTKEYTLNETNKVHAVTINISESDYELIIDDKPRTLNADGTIELSEGEHEIQITKRGYKTINETVIISECNSELNFELGRARFVNVYYLSNISGVTIYVDGIQLEGTLTARVPYPQILYPGTYEVKLEKPGYQSLTEQITITEDGENTFTFELEPLNASDERSESEIRVVSVEPVPNEFVSDRDPDNYDSNGYLAAGVIIETGLNGLSIVANNGFVRIPVQEGNTYRMLVSDDERVLAISADGFFPHEIILNDEGVQLQSGKFWRIKLSK
jgi:hypothetical protein